MSPPDQDDQTFNLTGGRPAQPAGLGPPLYTFPFPGGDWPEIGRHGEFRPEAAAGWWPARLIDRRGLRVCLSLTAAPPLPPVLSGQVRFFPRPPGPELKLPPGRPAPPGTALFLDPQEGWLWNATEAAGHKASLYEPEFWPTIARLDIPARLGAEGLYFVWLQAPDPEAATPRLLADYFLRAGSRLLVVGDSPADLEPMAGRPGAVFIGWATADSPLSQITLIPEAARRQAAREASLAEGQRRLAELRSAEAAQRARLSLWTNLDELERRFKDLGQDLKERSKKWARARAAMAARQAAWEAAALKLGGRLLPRLGRWLLARLHPSQPEVEEKRLRQALETSEAAVREVRRAEEAAWVEARNLAEGLRRERRESATWPARADLAAELERLAGAQKAAAETLAAENARPYPDPDQVIAEAPLVLALAADLAGFNHQFPTVLRLASLRPDTPARRHLAGLVLNAEKHLVVVGDFTFWPVWSGRAPAGPETPGSPAWQSFKVAEEKNELREFLASGGLFQPQPSRPKLSAAPRLTRLELGLGPNQAAPSAAVGLGLRALGEMGPVNPASALAVARAALDFARNRPEEPAALVLTASSAQGRLINLMLQDLETPPGRVLAGEPQAFNGWPRAPLVILEPAFEAPHQSHPWAWPTFGRWRLQLAWALAEEEIWLTGRGDWLQRLPFSAPLAALWRAAGPQRIPPPVFKTPGGLEILSQAQTEIWAFLPAPRADWWPAWKEPLLAAASRRLAVTVLTAAPGLEDDSDFINLALRELGQNQCTVGLASGFPGFLAVADNRHLVWGADGPDFQSGPLPLAADFLAGILQIKLIIEQTGRRGGGLKTCRRCGRPLVLVNQSQLRGLGDEQPLQVSCLGCHPPGRQRLDEFRDPFRAPPKCGQDHYTSYQRVRHGRHQEVWVCPKHPDGDPACPSYRVILGDCL